MTDRFKGQHFCNYEGSNSISGYDCFGQFIMKDQMLDRFFSEYFFIKNNGLIPTALSIYSRGRLRKLKDPEIYQKMTHEGAERLRWTCSLRKRE